MFLVRLSPASLICYFDTESVLIAIFFVIDEDEYFTESASGGWRKLKSNWCTAVWSNLHSWLLDIHKVWTAGTYVEYSGCQIRVSIRDLLVATVATADRQSHIKGFANNCFFGQHIHQPWPKHLHSISTHHLIASTIQWVKSCWWLTKIPRKNPVGHYPLLFCRMWVGQDQDPASCWRLAKISRKTPYVTTPFFSAVCGSVKVRTLPHVDDWPKFPGKPPMSLPPSFLPYVVRSRSGRCLIDLTG